MDIVAKVRAACSRGGLFAGKWALIVFAGVAAFALAVQALALVLAALALLVIALCLATICMPEESRAVWAWMRDTLCRWSAVAGTGSAEAGPAEAGPAEAGPAEAGSAEAGADDFGTAAAANAEPVKPASCEPNTRGPEADTSSKQVS